MKKAILLFVAVTISMFQANGQENMKKPIDKKGDKMMDKSMVKTISFEQKPGEFVQKELSISSGTYVFEIYNNQVGHDVGFVLVKKGQDVSNPKNHIQTAYVNKPVANGEKQKSSPTVLKKGEYVYFCPLNPTVTTNTITVL